MQTPLFLSVLITVAAVLFVVAYLLAQFIIQRARPVQGEATRAEADMPEEVRAEGRSSGRYHRLGGRVSRSRRRRRRR